MRLLGAAAFFVHCPSSREIYGKLGRRLTDIDVITSGVHKSNEIEGCFSELGFARQRHYLWHAAYREIYVNGDGLFVDVFRDTLSFSHDLDLRGRLELDSPTIPIDDLLLEKLQIHHITEKDIKDLVVLVSEHELGGREDRERFDTDYICGVLSDDWGFWYDAQQNIEKSREFLGRFEPADGKASARADERLEALASAVRESPKSARWHKRAKKGTRRIWYREVGEIQQGV